MLNVQIHLVLHNYLTIYFEQLLKRSFESIFYCSNQSLSFLNVMFAMMKKNFSEYWTSDSLYGTKFKVPRLIA